MKIIAVSATKGGVGKTTVSINVAAELVKRGHTVLVGDFDPQASATIALGMEPTDGRSAAAWMLGDGEIGEYIAKTKIDRLFLLGGSTNIIAARRNLEDALDAAGTVEEKRSVAGLIGDGIREELRGIEYVILDTPADNAVREACVYGSDVIVTPTLPTLLAIEGLNIFAAQVIDGISVLAGRRIPAIVVANMHDNRTRISRLYLAQIANGASDLGEGFQFGGVIHNAVAINESTGGTPVPLQRQKRNNVRAQTEIAGVVDVIMNVLGGE